MKKQLIILTLSAFAFTSCKKDGSGGSSLPPEDMRLATFKDNYYLDEPVDAFEESNASAVYTWDYGDGSTPASGKVGKHAYTKAGIYTIKLTSNGKTATKKIRVFPGHVSVSLQNSTFYYYPSMSVRIVDNKGYNVSSTMNYANFAPDQKIDTMYLKIPADANSPVYEVVIQLSADQSKNKYFTYRTYDISLYNHRHLDFNDKTQGWVSKGQGSSYVQSYTNFKDAYRY